MNTKTNTKTLFIVQSGFSLLKSFPTKKEAEDYAASLDATSYNNSVQYPYVQTYDPGELDYDDVDNGYFA